MIETHCQKCQLQVGIKPLLFISVRQRELVRVPISLVYLLIHATTGLCTLFPHLHVTCDVTCDMTSDVTLSLLMPHCVTQLSHAINRKEKKRK